MKELKPKFDKLFPNRGEPSVHSLHTIQVLFILLNYFTDFAKEKVLIKITTFICNTFTDIEMEICCDLQKLLKQRFLILVACCIISVVIELYFFHF